MSCCRPRLAADSSTCSRLRSDGSCDVYLLSSGIHAFPLKMGSCSCSENNEEAARQQQSALRQRGDSTERKNQDNSVAAETVSATPPPKPKAETVSIPPVKPPKVVWSEQAALLDEALESQQHTESSEICESLKIVTWNVWYESRYPKRAGGQDTLQHLRWKRLLTEACEKDPHVIALQEVSHDCKGARVI